VGQTRRELLQRIERLEHVLMEHRLSAVEGRAAGGRGPISDGELLDLPADFRLGGGR
jgi:hypothetical protein